MLFCDIVEYCAYQSYDYQCVHCNEKRNKNYTIIHQRSTIIIYIKTVWRYKPYKNIKKQQKQNKIVTSPLTP